MSTFAQDRLRLAEDHGVILPHVRGYVGDAGIPQFPAVTQPNSGIPANLSTYIDPTTIRAMITPTKAEQAYGEAKVGDWTTDTIQFKLVSQTGYVVSYGDFDKGGKADVNANWEYRQPFHFQTMIEWGEREIARMGLANLAWQSEKEAAATSIMNKARNLTYLFGVSGLQNYGILNDPSLPTALTPVQKPAASGTGTVTQWSQTNDPLAVYSDVLAMFQQMTEQTGGNATMESPMTLTIPTSLQQVMGYTNQFNLKLRDVLKENFPNLTIETIPEFGVALSGGYGTVNVAQLRLNTVDGIDTTYCGFTVKMMGHRVVYDTTSAYQKRSGGTAGFICRYPFAIVSLAGI